MRMFYYIFCRLSRLGMAMLQLAAVVSGRMSDGVGRSARHQPVTQRWPGAADNKSQR